jgi:tryptophan-rich sensory protein
MAADRRGYCDPMATTTAAGARRTETARSDRRRASGRDQALAATAFGLAALAAALLGSLATGATVGSSWFEALEKPPWYPPSWAFGAVWTPLYVLIAASGFLAWRAGADRRALGLWAGQMALNLGWSVTFFALRRPGWAVLVIVALAAAILATIEAFHRVHRGAAWMLAPYLAWVGFAATLNVAIAMLD